MAESLSQHTNPIALDTLDHGPSFHYFCKFGLPYWPCIIHT